MFGHLINNKLISPGRERRRIEKKIRLYSKEISLAKLFSRKFLRNAKFLLKKSDDVVYSAYSGLKRNMESLEEGIEKSYKKHEGIKRIRKLRRFEPKGKTFKKLADEISRDVSDMKDNMFGDIRKEEIIILAVRAAGEESCLLQTLNPAALKALQKI